MLSQFQIDDGLDSPIDEESKLKRGASLNEILEK